MIRHCVMLGLPRDYDHAELIAVMQGLKKVAARLPGCLGFLSGANLDLECKSQNFPFGFTLDFESTEVLQIYAQDPEHAALGQRLVKLCGGGDQIVVFDLDCVQTP